MCSNTCADLQLDNEHCGACESPCTGFGACTAGVCECFPNENIEKCGTHCAALPTDPEHCGACFNACPAGQTCNVGNCG